jgi:hypothetical protein
VAVVAPASLNGDSRRLPEGKNPQRCHHQGEHSANCPKKSNQPPSHRPHLTPTTPPRARDHGASRAAFPSHP